jgi:DNA-binding beta-propeller fold protein YncE
VLHPHARRRPGTAVLAFALGVGILVIGASPAAASITQPGFVRSIGMRGEAAVYPFAMDFNPVSHEILIGDYWNYRVRRYDLQGNQIGSFYLPPAQRHGQPYAVTTDPRNGEIYVTEWAEDKPRGWVSHWTAAGVFIDDFQLATTYDAWATIDSDGFLYLADSHATLNGPTRPPKVRKYDLDNGRTEVTSWGEWGTNPGQFQLIHGLDVDEQGRIYVAEAFNKTVDVFTTGGAFLFNFGSAGTGVGQFTGDLRGLAIDRANGWVYVVDAEASEIEKFDLAGDPLAHWGSEGFGLGQYADGGRDLTVDASGHVWVADFGNFRFFEYDSDGNLLHTYPDPAGAPAPGGFSQNRDVAVDPVSGDVWAVDTWNHRFQKFSPTGVLLGTWGFRNSHPPYGMDYPRGIAVDPATRDVWVVNTRDHVIRVYTKDGAYLKTIGTGLESDDPGGFRWPMDVEIVAGKAYVSAYHSRYLKVLNAATGAELLSIKRSNTGVAVDPATGDIYVSSWSRDTIEVYDAAGTLLRTFGTSGSADGQFQNVWDIDIVNGTLWAADSQLKRISAFALNGTFLGSFGSRGNGAYQFAGPSGLAHDAAGRLYIADALNDRIVVYDPSKGRPSGDTTAPTASISSPVNNAVLPGQTVILQGGAADAVGVGTVEVAIRDKVTLQWWNASIATWQTKKVWNLSAISGAQMTSVSWRFAFVGMVHGGSYSAQVRARDTSNNRTSSGLASRSFTVS